MVLLGGGSVSAPNPPMESEPPPPTRIWKACMPWFALLCVACYSSTKSDERKAAVVEVPSSSAMDKPEKKERSSSKAGKEKSRGEKVAAMSSDMVDEREPRKERKVARKRDRAEEALILAEKRRKEEEKAAKMQSHQNGDPMDHGREKHHYTSSSNRVSPREKSPYVRERERSHDRDGRDKHRRSSEAKRR